MKSGLEDRNNVPRCQNDGEHHISLNEVRPGRPEQLRGIRDNIREITVSQ